MKFLWELFRRKTDVKLPNESEGEQKKKSKLGLGKSANAGIGESSTGQSEKCAAQKPQNTPPRE